MVHIKKEGLPGKPGFNIGITRWGWGIGSIVMLWKTKGGHRERYLRIRWLPFPFKIFYQRYEV